MSKKALWNQPAPVLPGRGAKGAAVMEAPRTAEDAAAESHRQLVERGWCAWRCEGLGGDTVIVVVGEDIKGYPEGYPVYNLQELRDILPLDDKLLQAAHRAKKELGARVEGAGTKPVEEGK